MRKFLTFTLPISLIVGLQTNPATAAVKAGSACKKINSTTKSGSTTLKCVMSGKRLVWKAIATALPAPIQPPVTVTSKLGDQCKEYLAILAGEDLVCEWKEWALTWKKHAAPLSTRASAAFQSVSAEIAKIQPGWANLQFYVSPTFETWRAENMKVAMQKAYSFWTPIFEQKDPLPILFLTEEDRDWYKATLEKLNAPEASKKDLLDVFDLRVGQKGARVAHAMAGITGFRINYYLLGSLWPSGDGVGWVQVPAHEWTHNVQGEVGSNLPCWFKEGHSFYYGTALGARNDTEFRDLRREATWDNGEVKITSVPPGGWGNWLDGRIFDFAAYTCGPDGTYVIGFLAMEYLLSLKGHDGVVAYMRQTKKEPWDKALVTIYGVTWTELKTQIDRYLEEAAKDFSNG